MYIKNRSGPKIDPCGTPHVIKPSSEKTPSRDTKKFLLERYGLNQLITAAAFCPLVDLRFSPEVSC